MRKTRINLAIIMSALTGAICGMIGTPAPVGAVAKEIYQLLTNVSNLQQGQRDMQSAIDTKFAQLSTLLVQSTDSTNKLNATNAGLQKTLQDIQANTGAQLNAMAAQGQGISENISETQSRLSRINAQLTELQNEIQTLDAKVSALSQPAPKPADTPPAVNSAPAPPASPGVLYDTARNDFSSGKYDLAIQEFRDYVKYFPATDLASNAVFYQGEIAYNQHRYDDAVSAYSAVIADYPKSDKLSDALYERALSYLQIHQRQSAVNDLRRVIQLHRNDEPQARAKLRELGLPAGGRQ